MECLQSRIDSFSKSKRVKKGSGTTTLKWPHPTSSNSSASSSFKATPATLAEAGFYFDPSVEDPDNVTCFMCQKELGGWEADDDPFQIHYEKCKTRCPWALLRCGLMDDIDRHGRFVFLDKSRFPTSKAMEKARLETFTVGGGWIHDQTRGHGASSKKLAKAGFVHTPQHPGDDLVVCLYCNVSLSGWDEDDDPMEEHRSRKDKSGYPCPFFPSSPPSSDSISPPNNVPSSKTTFKSKPRSTKPSSRAQQYEDMAMPTKTHDGDLSGDDEDGNASESAKSTKSTRSSSRKSTATGTSKTPRKPSSSSTRKPSSTGAKTPKARSVSRASSRTALNNVKEEDEVDEDGDNEVASEDEVRPKPKKPTKASTAKTPAKANRSTTARGRSRSVVPSETEADVLAKEDDAEEETAEPPATVRKGGRTASKAKAVATPAAKKTKSRSKSVARSVRESEGEDEEPDEVVEPPKTAKRPKSKATATSKKAPSRAPVQDESEAGSDVNMDEAWTTAPETERKASKSTKKVKEKKAAVEEETNAFKDAEEDVPRTVKKPSSKSKAPTTSKAKPPSKSKPKTVKQAVASGSEDEVQAQLEKVEPPTAKKPSQSTSSKPKPAEKENPKSKSAATKPSSSRRAKEETEGETEQETDREAEDGGAKDEEDEFGPIIRQPSFTAAAPKKKIDLSAVGVGKGKPSSKNNGKSKSRNEEAEDDEAPEPKGGTAMKVKPPSKKTPPMMMNVKFSSGKDGDGDVDMTPLFAPKRAAAPPSGQSSERGLKPPSQRSANQKKQIQVVDVSSDDEDEEQRPTIKLVKPKKSSVPLPLVAPIKESKRDEPVFEEHDEGADDDVMNLNEQREVEMDMVMGDEDEQTLREPPKTPLRAQAPIFPPLHLTQPLSSSSSLLPSSSSSLQPPQARSSSSHPEPPQSSEVPEQEPETPPFFPPLSKLPFMPLPSLTPAELDMSVEEWVRYQMEMEYDKFKRDGERELVRFRRKADEVRKVIEGL